MRVSSTDPTLYLLDLHDIERDSLPNYTRVYRPHMKAIIDWAHSYLCQSHVDLGREGPVCPYTQSSLERRLFLLTVYPGSDPILEEASVVIIKYGDGFWS